MKDRLVPLPHSWIWEILGRTARQSVRLSPRGSPATCTVDGVANRGCAPAVTVVLGRDTLLRGVPPRHLSGAGGAFSLP